MKQVTKKQREFLMERCRGRCEHCGNFPDWRGLSVHHLIHKGMGGSKRPEIHDISNLELWCGKCHEVEHG